MRYKLLILNYPHTCSGRLSFVYIIFLFIHLYISIPISFISQLSVPPCRRLAFSFQYLHSVCVWQNQRKLLKHESAAAAAASAAKQTTNQHQRQRHKPKQSRGSSLFLNLWFLFAVGLPCRRAACCWFDQTWLFVSFFFYFVVFPVILLVVLCLSSGLLTLVFYLKRILNSDEI